MVYKGNLRWEDLIKSVSYSYPHPKAACQDFLIPVCHYDTGGTLSARLVRLLRAIVRMSSLPNRTCFERGLSPFTMHEFILAAPQTGSSRRFRI